jgi:iron complex outermembrane receptor protein
MIGSYGAAASYVRGGVGDERAGALVAVRLEGAQNDYELVDDRGTRFDPSDDRVVRRANADAQTYDAWSIGHAELGKRGSVDLLAHVAQREQGIPGLSLFPTQAARVRLSRELAGFTTRLQASERVSVAATSSALLTRAHYTDPLLEAGLGGSRVDVLGARGDQGLQARVQVTDRIDAVPVVRAALEELATDGDGTHLLRARRTFGRAGLSAGWRMPLEGGDEVRARALASLECHGTHAHGSAAFSGTRTDVARDELCDAKIPAARLSGLYGRPTLSFLANAGRYGRAPTLGELYGISGVVRGNDALGTETGWTLDAGARSEGGVRAPKVLRGAWIDAFLFARFADDLIAYRRSALGYVRPYNEGGARVLGAELGAGVRPLSFLSADVAATLTDPRSTTATTTSTLLPYQSRLVTFARVEAEARPKSKISPVAKLALAYRWESARVADQAGLVEIPSQGSLDAEGSISVYKEAVIVRVRAQNLLDETRFDVVGYPLPGRAFYASLEGQL